MGCSASINGLCPGGPGSVLALGMAGREQPKSDMVPVEETLGAILCRLSKKLPLRSTCS